jgi:DNA-binding IclR family transcriptional regulator
MISAREAKSAPVGVIGKVLRILEALRRSPAGLSLRDICIETRINKSTAYRFLAHLEREGYLFRDEAGAYVVGPKLVGLAGGATYQTALRNVSRPILQKLWKITGETVNLGILDGQHVYYLDVLQSPHAFRMASHAGMWRPLYCTAMGKVLGAWLPADERKHVFSSLRFERVTPHTIVQVSRLERELHKIRDSGFALDDEEAVLGARCVAAPILLESGKAAAALSVSGPTTRIDRAKVPTFVTAVKGAARAISIRLGASDLLPAAARNGGAGACEISVRSMNAPSKRGAKAHAMFSRG